MCVRVQRRRKERVCARPLIHTRTHSLRVRQLNWHLQPLVIKGWLPAIRSLETQRQTEGIKKGVRRITNIIEITNQISSPFYNIDITLSLLVFVRNDLCLVYVIKQFLFVHYKSFFHSWILQFLCFYCLKKVKWIQSLHCGIKLRQIFFYTCLVLIKKRRNSFCSFLNQLDFPVDTQGNSLL